MHKTSLMLPFIIRNRMRREKKRRHRSRLKARHFGKTLATVGLSSRITTNHCIMAPCIYFLYHGLSYKI